MDTNQECTIALAEQMVEIRMLRGLVNCPVHGFHNPYNMYKSNH